MTKTEYDNLPLIEGRKAYSVSSLDIEVTTRGDLTLTYTYNNAPNCKTYSMHGISKDITWDFGIHNFVDGNIILLLGSEYANATNINIYMTLEYTKTTD